MPKPFFRFKQFTVYHDRCAMKVGTDGVLLGAWTDVNDASSILDIGTGTGIIALMLAQRSTAAVIKGVDIDGDAVEQAQENVSHTPWADRIVIEQADACRLPETETVRYDVVVSNPPYFTETMKCPDNRRHAARHTDTLTFDKLLHAASQLMHEKGRFCVVLPASAEGSFVTEAALHHLYPCRRTAVQTKAGVPPKRVLLEFRREITRCQSDTLTIEDTPGTYSAQYRALTGDFYLNM